MFSCFLFLKDHNVVNTRLHGILVTSFGCGTTQNFATAIRGLVHADYLFICPEEAVFWSLLSGYPHIVVRLWTVSEGVIFLSTVSWISFRFLFMFVYWGTSYQVKYLICMLCHLLSIKEYFDFVTWRKCYEQHIHTLLTTTHKIKVWFLPNLFVWFVTFVLLNVPYNRYFLRKTLSVTLSDTNSEPWPYIYIGLYI